MNLRINAAGLVVALTMAISAGAASAETEFSPDAAQLPDGELLAQIETPEQAVIYANVRNLAARWNTIIGSAETGQDILDAMAASGIFAEGASFAFNLPDGNVIGFEGLEDEVAQQFYGQFMEGLTKARHNVTTNTEIVRFTEAGADARFRWLVFMGERYSLGGIVQVSMESIEGRYRFTDLTLNIQRFDTQHAYENGI